MTAVLSTDPPSAAPTQVRGGILGRQLASYPTNGARAFYLGVVVLATITLYYQLYVGGSVSTLIINDLGMSLNYFIVVSIVGNALGALASIVAGAADRWGRSNIVVYGLLVTSLLVAFAIPASPNKGVYLGLVALVSFVEGMILVATPALVRDFSPQLGRASAMGFWTLGPVIGSLIVTLVSTNTLPSHPNWEFQLRVCGIASLAVFVLAFFGLRELAPRLRDQLMVSLRERELVEARARNIDPDEVLEGAWKQMLRKDIIGPAVAIGLYLLFYFTAAGFFVVFFASNYGYSESKANSLGTWYWASNAVALIVSGVLSDRLKVRKPFMLAGGLLSLVGVALFAIATGDTSTTYNHFVVLILMVSVGTGIAFAAWMAAFTETVEKHNPAATATGLAVWGATVRTIATLSLVAMIFAIPAVATLVDHGPRITQIAKTYPKELATLGKIDVPTQQALAKNPKDPLAGVAAVSAISGLPVADVAQVSTLGTKYAEELKTAKAIDPATQAALAKNPADPAAGGAAVGQIATALKVTPAEATGRLVALGKVPPADMAFIGAKGPAVEAAVADLTATGKIPPADVKYLQDHGADVQKAATDGPKQWERWWWIAFAGQLAFLPFIGLLTGRWSPKKAREDAAEHDAAVSRELQELRTS